jgi:N-ethylmaleimide reductase
LVRTLITNQWERPRSEIGVEMATGRADLEAYGQTFLANPDFVERLKSGAPMKDAKRDTYFAGGAQGYVDYPALSEAVAV